MTDIPILAAQIYDTFSDVVAVLAPTGATSPTRHTRFRGHVVSRMEQIQGRPIHVRPGPRRRGNAMMVLTGAPPKTRPLVLCCSPRLPPYVYAGGETAMLGLCSSLQRRGCDVVAVEGEGPGGVEVIKGVLMHSGFPRWETKYTKPLLARLKPDVIVTQFEAAHPFLEHSGGVPVYVYCHVRWSYDHPVEQGMKPAGWIFTSYALWNECGQPKNSVVVHPILDRMRVCGWHGKRKNITMVNPSYLKGGDVVLSLSHAFPDEHFVVARGGYGADVEGLEARPNVEFLGPLHDLRPFYGNSKLHLVPSRSETYGMAAAEARLAGVPVVASDLPGLHEALPDSAWYAPPGDHTSWAMVVGEVLRRRVVSTPATQHYETQAEEDLRALENLWTGRHRLVTSSGNPRVTVMLVSHNRPKFLRQALAGIQRQTLSDWEVIIIDDSTDPAVHRFLRSIKDPRISWHYHANANLSWKRNQVLRLARAPIVANNDDDDISLPTRLEETVNAFAADPELGILWGYAVLINEKGDAVGRHRWDAEEKRIRVHSGSAAWRTKWAREVMYNEKWSPPGERWRPGHDYDFYKRYRAIHPKQLAIPKDLVHYRVVGPRVSSKRSW